MTRYVTRSAIIANPQDDRPFSLYDLGNLPAATEVFEAEPYRNTGVLDASGQTIWATDKGPLGFGDRK